MVDLVDLAGPAMVDLAGPAVRATASVTVAPAGFGEWPS
jgi:hypothetical protein